MPEPTITLEQVRAIVQEQREKCLSTAWKLYEETLHFNQPEINKADFFQRFRATDLPIDLQVLNKYFP